MGCAAISFWHYPSISAKSKAGSFVGLDEEIKVEPNCADLPYVKLEELISSNLGMQGPDEGKEEGLIYRASLLHVGAKKHFCGSSHTYTFEF